MGHILFYIVIWYIYKAKSPNDRLKYGQTTD